jgi:peptidoglycan/xylan/chitin deacetylase (PgdA/CDA1 family)
VIGRGGSHNRSSTAIQTPRGNTRLPVLLYHHVGSVRAGTFRSLTIPPKRFERQIRWLAEQHFSGVSSSDLLGWLREGRPLRPHPVLLTFDDGYADLADFAFPVLRRYGFGAIVFLVSGQIGKTNNWDEANGSGTHRLLTTPQIHDWRARGIEFGAHGRTHADLTLPETDVLGEVAGSAADLEELLGQKASSFAYPHGAVNAAARASVVRFFDLAFTARSGLNDARTDGYLLHRSMVQPDDRLLDLRCRVTIGLSPVESLRGAVRFRTRMRAAGRLLQRRL